MNQLQIKDGHLKIYTISNAGITVKHFRNKTLPTEEHFPFEQIKRDKLFFINRSPTYLVLGGVSIILFTMLLMTIEQKSTGALLISWLFGLLGLLSISLYFLLQQKVYFIKTFTGKFIKFRVKRNEVEIAQFVQQALQERDRYLKQKYGKPNPYQPFDAQHSNFNIMLKENVLTQEEFDNNTAELKLLFNQSVPKEIFPGYSHN